MMFAGLRRVDQRETEVRHLRGLMLDGQRESMQPRGCPASACVARPYSGTLGKVGNCQIAVRVHAQPIRRRRCWTGGCSFRSPGTRLRARRCRNVANAHARRLRRQPVTLDQAGKKKPQVRKEVPREEQILRRRAASKIPDSERYRPKWLMALEMINELVVWTDHDAAVVDANDGGCCSTT